MLCVLLIETCEQRVEEDRKCEVVLSPVHLRFESHLYIDTPTESINRAGYGGSHTSAARDSQVDSRLTDRNRHASDPRRDRGRDGLQISERCRRASSSVAEEG